MQVIYRYDYEACETEQAEAMMAHLTALVENGSLVNQSITSATGKMYTVQKMDNFKYVDPIDKTVTSKQVRCII